MVVAILSLLTVTLLVTLNPLVQLQKAKDGARKSDLAQIQRALETYYQDHGRYPSSNTSYQIMGDSGPVGWGSSWQPYINVLPQDPGGKTYVYYSPSLDNGQTYYLYASLDRGAQDPQVCQNLNLSTGECPSIASNGIKQDACGGPCDYGVSSPNVSP
ncbi:type II secretion system protein GspG [Patescibacteria group bacterium]|nr:type II secretion system protein GspG [Patescibacteria group bacterium]MCL5010325.1 type II secretion system protein GspG [Patescibacteria group bacterium]